MRTYTLQRRWARVAFELVPGALVLTYAIALTVGSIVSDEVSIAGALFIDSIVAFCVWWSLRSPYRAHVSDDGTVVLDSLLTAKTVSANDLACIEIQRSIWPGPTDGVKIYCTGYNPYIQLCAHQGDIYSFAADVRGLHPGLVVKVRFIGWPWTPFERLSAQDLNSLAERRE